MTSDPNLRKELKDSLLVVHESLLTRVTEIQEIRKEVEKNGDKVDRLLKSVEGNGRPPISERIAAVELVQEQISASCEKHDRQIDKFKWWIIGLLVGIIGSLSATVGILIKVQGES